MDCPSAPSKRAAHAAGRAWRAAGIALALGAAPVAAAHGERITLPAPGAELYAPSRACLAKVLEDPVARARSSLGAVLRARLYANGYLVRDVGGVREMAWVGEVLVFAVSPLGGDPGVYAWECPGNTVRRVVKPSRSSRAHPLGTDFFQLVGIDGDVLYYAHAADVDSPTLERDLERGVEMLRLRPFRPRVSMR
ncbi:MAG TPA: hypothetical protein VEG27_13515 [Usitatibacter sp.]|nr:hypothetical protein [Usitatibacter sp.]